MSNLPKQYLWLEKEPGPKMIIEGLKTFGVLEGPGTSNNPIIMGWANEIGAPGKFYNADSVPWCGLWMALIAKRAGKPIPEKPLWALNWGKWGYEIHQPELGNILVFLRPSGGHVGLYVGEDKKAYHVLGGNQSNRVSITRVDKTRLKYCRYFYNTAKPSNVRPIILDVAGLPLSEDEA